MPEAPSSGSGGSTGSGGSGGAPATRPFWSGTITFGLVSVPVDLYPARQSSRTSLRWLAPDGTPVSRRYVCPREDVEVPREHIVRGYEVAPGEHVLVTDEELEALEPRKSRDIDLRRFVPRESIDPIYFDRPYLLAPAGESTKAYRLLAEAMERLDRAGVATFVMRGKESLVAILAEGGLLRAEVLRFADEVRSPADVGLPPIPHDLAAPDPMLAAIDAASEDALDLAELEDPNAGKLRELAEAKRERGEDVVERTVDADADLDVPPSAPDLMNVLKWSLQRGRSKRARQNGSETPPGASSSEEPSKAPALESLTKSELYERAQEIDLPGRSSMSKSELVDALRTA